MQVQVMELNKRFEGIETGELLSWFTAEYAGRIAFSTSLGAEDQVITHYLAKTGHPAALFTLDTGRMFQETYDLLEITRTKYQLPIRVFFPDAAKVEEMVNSKGINLFYESLENRHLCCNIRKIEPLTRALSGMAVWITGMRREQSVTRRQSALVEWDEKYNLMKLNPLIDWTEEMLREKIREENIPINELHAQGYPSIGCKPCTRAVLPGEDVRSGRWWWELPEFRECGLHKRADK
jgi:phosphoadenosine phosphosulfate reductase